MYSTWRRLSVFLYPLLFIPYLSGQVVRTTDRLASSLDTSHVVQLPGNTRALKFRGVDQGAVEGTFPLPYITLTFAPSARQRADLQKLLTQQQNPASRQYHRWLTPEQYADRFGLSLHDSQVLRQWLQQQGFSIVQTARGRNWIAFSGTAAQVEMAFHTEIHRYSGKTGTYFANAVEPSIPHELQGIVAGYRGLDDFAVGALSSANRKVRTAGATVVKASDTIVITNPDDGTVTISHVLVPDDVATIYNLTPLYNAGTDGTGQQLVVVGQSDVSLTDLEQFRQKFNLPANDPEIVLVPGSDNPGHTADEFQAAMDLEWAGAVALNAKIKYVYAAPSAGGALASAQYAIDNNLAPVIAISYGSCEQTLAGTPISSFETELQKANALGITVVASTGTSGPAACDAADQFPTSQAILGLAVNYPASSPEVTAVGGSEFKEGTGNYWSFDNGPNLGSVLSYIPETVWNDTKTLSNLAASGGGMSSCITTSGNQCTGGFAKPVWQNIFGVPPDGVRDVPDLAFASSQSHDGYVVCSGGTCSQGSGPPRDIVQGVSAATPIFAGMLTLVNQHFVQVGIQASPGLGNINPGLYQLVQTGFPAVFHDITSGNNIVPCLATTPNCEVVSPTTPNPLPFGFTAAAGYDQGTGLGSLDASNFATAFGWSAAGNLRATITRLAVTIPPNAVPTQQVLPGTMLDFTATMSVVGSNVATGTITLVSGSTQLGSGLLIGGVADIFITPPVGGYSITAVYSGDGNYEGSTSEAVSLFVADFTVTTSSTDFTVQRGDAAYIPVTITPAFSNYSPVLSLQCFGAPTESTCTFKPSTVQPAGGPVTATMVVQTTQATGRIVRPTHWGGKLFLALALPGLVGTVFLSLSVRSHRWPLRVLAILSLVVLMSVGWIACATASRLPDPGSQPVGPIPLNVTATTGGTNPIFHSVKIMMNLK